MTYTLRITNSGTISATGITITDILPADVIYESGDAEPDETGFAGRTVVWDNLGPVSAEGATVVITMPVKVKSKVADGVTLTDTMSVDYRNAAGHIFLTHWATDTSTVESPVLSIVKTGSPNPVLTGHAISYTLSYANNGPSAANNVVITDVVPLSTTFGACSPSPCGWTSGTVSWTVDVLPAGAHDSVKFSAVVSDDLATGTLIQNTEYGMIADETGYISGPPANTLVNRQAAVIEGYTFVDDNLNGEFDLGESTLIGITVTLPSALNPVTFTNSSGYYSFRVEEPGPISVTADVPDGYFRVTSGTVFTDAVLGITQTISFGYLPTSSPVGAIYGTVFDDANHNNTQDIGEKGLAQVL